MFEYHGADVPRAATPWRRPLLWLATAPLLVAVSVVFERDASLWAQTASPLEGVEIPTSLEPGSQLNIDSSEAMRLVNDALRSRFSSLYGDAEVEVVYESADAAIQSVIEGDTELAAVGRALTDAETSAGLREVPVSRQKIAILISPSNPFAGSLTIDQFAQIFRGEITNWSEVGGPDAPIVLVDHPETSDTRQAFRNYPVFEAAPFEAAPNAVALSEPSTEAIAATLNENGISYVVAEQALNNPAVKIVPMHDTLPDDQRYPFSQPLSYVYNAETATPAALAFLGFAINPDNEALIEAARTAATTSPDANPDAEPTAEAEVDATPAQEAEATPETTLEPTDPVAVAPVPARGLPWWPWLLALPLLGGLLWWLLKDRAPAAAPLAATADRRIILTPRNCRDAYAYWELPEAEVEALRQQDCSLALKLHDVTDIANVDRQAPHRTYPFDCDTVAVGDLHLPVDVDNRDYLVELGYLGNDATWHALARSAHVRVPACPSTITQAAPGIGAAAAAAAGLGAAELGAAAMARPAQTTAPARVILTPRDCKHAYAYWELPQSTVGDLKTGSRALKARLYDVTELPGNGHGLNSLQEFNAPLETPGDLHLPIAIDDRDYVVEIGYVDSNYQWQTLAKSEVIRVPACPTPAAAAAVGTSLGASLGGATGLANGGKAAPAEPAPVPGTAIAGAAAGAAALGAATLWSRTADPVAAPIAEAESIPAAGVGRRTDMGVESKIILVPRSADAAYAYWEVAPPHREALQQEGGRVLALRIHDATNLELDYQAAHATQEYILQANDTDRHVPIPTPDRDYVAELGYLTDSGQWLQLVRSLHVRVPAA
ncbi:phosphate ABC transporter substrate-binding protein [filamentous cyanobacterium CCP3]|nr:phosphate ABC transporter substrate-binding protein [filamentous cyanobacterium CCP3]